MKRKKWNTAVGGLLAAAMCCGLCLSGCSSDDTIVLRFADTSVDGEPDAEGNKYFAQLVEERTDGRVRVEYYNNGMLGADKIITQAAIVGTLDMAKCSAGNFTEYSDVLNFTELPGIFQDVAHARRVFQNEEIRTELTEAIREDTGLTVIMYDIDSGAPRVVGTTSKEVRVPEDMKGLSFRTTGSPLGNALYAHLGVNAVTVDFSELYTALQQNLINGIYLQASWIDSSKLQENLDYITPTEVTYAISVKAMSSDAVEKLGPELLGIVMECGEEAEAYKDGLWDAWNEEVYERISESSEIVELTEEERALWWESTQVLWDDFVGKSISQELVDKITALEN